ncbi:MAG: iron-sulfur cluster assembly protein [Thermoplasmata archaeon]
MSDSPAATAPPASPAPSAPGPSSVAPTASNVPQMTGGVYAEREGAIVKQLKNIYDPEIPMNIVDLGLIYGFDWKEDSVNLRMTLTAPGCPVAGILADEIKAAIEKVPEVKSATVEMIWDPPWTPDRMSEFAKRQFGYL